MSRTALTALHNAIDRRVAAIRDDQPDWLCGKGCDGCCRHLAALPQLTPAEWVLLQEGLATLPPEQHDTIRSRLAAHGDHPPAPVTCPLLDPASGACPVYAHRPVACRTYGFYVQRDKGLYCGQIEAQAARGELDHVIWGNHETVERELATSGEARSLAAWFAQG